MHATVCLLRAGQPKSAGVAAKSVQFIGQFSWVTSDPIGQKGLYSRIDEALYNPFRTIAIKKLLEMIGRVCLYPRYLVCDRSRLRHKPDYRHGWLIEYVRKSMHACHSLLRAGQPNSAGVAAKSVQFIGQFSWVTGDPISQKGLYSRIDEALYNPFRTIAIKKLLEMIGRVHLYPRYLVCDRSRLGHKPDYRHGWLIEYVRKSMHACHSLSVACRPAEYEIGSFHRSILVGHRWPNRPERVKHWRTLSK